MLDGVCAACGELRGIIARNLCTRCYQRAGIDLTAFPTGVQGTDEIARFERRVRAFERRVERGSDDECWLWTGSMGARGYGRLPKKLLGERLVHRIAYRLWVGPIPDGMTIEHACHSASECTASVVCAHRRCLNPGHLAVLPPLENAALQHRVPREVCPSGHRLEGDNVFVNNRGVRCCRQCARERGRRYDAERRIAS